MKIVKWMLVTGAAAALVACGGGGGDSGTTPFGSGSGTGTGTSTTGTGTTGVAANTAGSVVLNLSSSVISASAPGTVTALVKDATGAAVPNAIVTFSLSSAIATISPSSVLTDASGQASTVISPASSSSLGAAYVSASADTSSGTLTTKIAFSVSAVNVTLNALTASSAPVSAYGSTALNFDVTGASASSPVSVTFNSTCAAAGKAIISPTSISVTSSSGSVTYQDKGCNASDRISATIVGTSQQKTLDLLVQAPATQSIQFVSATPDTICLAGSGCPASSVVSFKVTDQFGNPVAGQAVDFSLDISGVANLSFASANTNASGQVDVSVLSKTIPTPIRVKAAVRGTSLSTVSNLLAINAGLPTEKSVSFSATAYNVDGMDRDGQTSSIRVQLNDRFGNPVPDGTAVSFVAEGAAVIPARCTTSSAVCNVTFVSSNFRPTDGRVTVVAYAQGEETFADVDGDNLYTSGEAFEDLGQVFIDKNENGTLDAGEYVAGSAVNGTWDGNTYVRATRVFVLSSSSRSPRLFDVDGSGNCSSTPLASFDLALTAGGVCTAQKTFCLRDGNSAADALGGNPVPVGTALSATTKAKDATIQISNNAIGGNTNAPTIHTLTAQLADCSKGDTPGQIDLSITMPNSGPIYPFIGIGNIK